jgi:hypothetical protein
LFIELAAAHLRRAAMNPDPNATDVSVCITQAEELIERARMRASEL